MRDPHYGRMCFKSVKTVGALGLYLIRRTEISKICTISYVMASGVYNHQGVEMAHTWRSPATSGEGGGGCMLNWTRRTPL